jgi:hypothetical protein
MDDRVQRARHADLHASTDRLTPGPGSGVARRLVQIFNAGSMPTAPNLFYAAHPVEMDGAEQEGIAGSPTPDVNQTIIVLVLGTQAPAVGDILTAYAVGGRWVAERGSGVPPGILVACCMTTCLPCMIPDQDLLISWTNTKSGPGSIALPLSGTNQQFPRASGCDPNGLMYSLACTAGQVELRAEYWSTGECPMPPSTDFCGNLHDVTSYTLSGPTSGPTGVISQNFAVQLIGPNAVGGADPAIVHVTPSDNGAAGAFSPPSVSLFQGGPLGVFAYAAKTDGKATITTTSTPSLIDPPAVSYTSPTPRPSYTISGPTSGLTGAFSASYTVSLVSPGPFQGSAVVTFSDGGNGGSFNQGFLRLSSATPTLVFTYRPVDDGAVAISLANDAGWSNPPPMAYTSTTPPAAAPAYSLTGPAAGFMGFPSAPLLIALNGTGPIIGTVTITPNDAGHGGTFVPGTIAFTTTNRSGQFVYTPATTGTPLLSTTNNGMLVDPPGITYTSAAATVAYTLAGPTSGPIAAASLPFTVTLVGAGPLATPALITPSDGTVGAGAGTFTPASVQLPGPLGQLSQTFTYTNANAHGYTISTTNNAGLINPPGISFTVPYASPQTFTLSATCLPLSLVFALTESSCPTLWNLGYTSFTISNPNAVPLADNLCCAGVQSSQCVAVPDTTFQIYDKQDGNLIVSGTTDDNGAAYVTWVCPQPTYTLSGPTSGPLGPMLANQSFTVSLVFSRGRPGGASTTITPNDGGAGGAFTPPSVQLSGFLASATFTYSSGTTFTLTQAAISGLAVTYSGTITGGDANAFAGLAIIVSGFANAGNNGTFSITSSSSTTLVVLNSSGVNETHAATALKAPAALPITIATTNNAGWADPPPISYTCPLSSPTYTLSGPTSGPIGFTSNQMTPGTAGVFYLGIAAPILPIPIFLSDGGAGGAFSANEIGTLPGPCGLNCFTYIAPGAGTYTITATTGIEGYNDPPPIKYTGFASPNRYYVTASGETPSGTQTYAGYQTINCSGAVSLQLSYPTPNPLCCGACPVDKGPNINGTPSNMTLTDGTGSYPLFFFDLGGQPFWYTVGAAATGKPVGVGTEVGPGIECQDWTIETGDVPVGYSVVPLPQPDGSCQFKVTRGWQYYGCATPCGTPLGNNCDTPFPLGTYAYFPEGGCVWSTELFLTCQYPVGDSATVTAPLSSCDPVTWSGTPTGAGGPLGDPVGGSVAIEAS